MNHKPGTIPGFFNFTIDLVYHFDRIGESNNYRETKK